MTLRFSIDRPDLMSIMTTIAQQTHPPRTLDTISIRQRSGIWRVAVNGRFYGDYVRRYWAIEAAVEKADAIAADGGAAIITIAMDGVQDALLYDTRAPTSPGARGKRRKAPLSKARHWASAVGDAFLNARSRDHNAGNAETQPLFIRA